MPCLLKVHNILQSYHTDSVALVIYQMCQLVKLLKPEPSLTLGIHISKSREKTWKAAGLVCSVMSTDYAALDRNEAVWAKGTVESSLSGLVLSSTCELVDRKGKLKYKAVA